MSHYAQNYMSDEIVHSQRRRMMKRLITSLLSLVIVFVMSATALATSPSGWKVDISVPANTTKKTFNVQFTTLSVGKDDDITVELFQNGTSQGSQTTTTDYGDSGAFSVTVPAVGTYSYYLKAVNTTDASPKTTATVNVVVSDVPAPIVTNVNTATTSTNASGQSANGSATANGDTDGQVSDNAASTDKDAKDVLGDSDKKDGDKDNSQSWGNTVGVILLLLAVAGGYYYMVMRKANKD